MKKPSKKISSINVVPYLDVMLVLLVIFMITAPLFTLGEIRLPESGDVTTSGGAGIRIIYRIGEGRPLELEDPKNPGEKHPPTDIRGLLDRLRLICWGDGKKRSIIIAADYNRFYGEVVEDLMNAVRDAECEGDFALTVLPKK